MKTLVVFGGTFNPFHIGHEQMLSALCGEAWIDKILVIPSNIPPHKKVDFLASDEHRIAFCRLVCNKYSKSEVSDIEIKREGKSYTVDTLKELRKLYPDYDIYFAIGGDMAESFSEWYQYEFILEKASLVVFSRVSPNGIYFDKSIDNLRSLGAKIKVMETEIANISSTEIRDAIKDKSFLKKYLPKEVFDYLIKEKVYLD